MNKALMPVMGCQMGCRGCYESEIFRKNGNKPTKYSLPVIQETVERLGFEPDEQWMIHGGEPLLMPLPDLTRLVEMGGEHGQRLTIQTNAAAITDAHVELFAKWRVYVGVSLNGPARLNRDRRAGSIATGVAPDEITDRLTDKIHRNIRLLRLRRVPVGMLTVLSRTNASTDEDVDTLIAWAQAWGEEYGVWEWRWNLLHQDDQAKDDHDVELTPERATAVWCRLADAAYADPRRLWNPFREVRQNLTGPFAGPCHLAPCDVYATDAVFAVYGDGSLGNCQMPAQDGVLTSRSHGPVHTRQSVLRAIPMEDGGCQGCQYWDICHGGCPGEGVGGDWRNKSRFCGAWYGLYDHVKATL